MHHSINDLRKRISASFVKVVSKVVTGAFFVRRSLSATVSVWASGLPSTSSCDVGRAGLAVRCVDRPGAPIACRGLAGAHGCGELAAVRLSPSWAGPRYYSGLRVPRPLARARLLVSSRGAEFSYCGRTGSVVIESGPPSPHPGPGPPARAWPPVVSKPFTQTGFLKLSVKWLQSNAMVVSNLQPAPHRKRVKD
jgi:hypothetical protein